MLLILFLLAFILARTVAVHPSDFAAAPTIPVRAIQSAAAQASQVPQLATHPISDGETSTNATIHDDWSSFEKGAAITWTADMDVDCDGMDFGCKGNPDGQSITNWGALSAYDVPFIVIPDDFLSANRDKMPGNNVAAVICNGNMYFGILGDSNGDTPLVTGEASWLMARTCFPDDNLDGSKGHVAADVTYIVFTGQDAVLPSSALNKHYITDFNCDDKPGNPQKGHTGMRSGAAGTANIASSFKKRSILVLTASLMTWFA
ncbi:hypothetical protein EYZ11_000298 [Aspergillus tanneri]|uniref:Endo-chitosanase n=1 Tax=Aspergillus tanneri TaxID=1220188 RepID=A0A4S3JXR0_9EURO|nr:hypothetical protein EYZ11_000298 [Aspergillus tanneri]